MVVFCGPKQKKWRRREGTVKGVARWEGKWSTLSLTLSLSLSLTVLASHSLTPTFLTAFARLVIHIR